MSTPDPRLARLIEWIRSTAPSNQGSGALIPVSGGSDSALCFWSCVQAMAPGEAVAVYVGEDLRCAAWFHSVGHVDVVPKPSGADAEAQRWMLMVARARAERRWLVGSRNRTEDVLGTYSFASRLATYLPLAGLWKSDVMNLAVLAGVPNEIMHSSRLPDNACGRPPELSAIGLETIDRFAQVKLGMRPRADLEALLESQVEYLEDLYRRHHFKSELPLRGPLV